MYIALNSTHFHLDNSYRHLLLVQILVGKYIGKLIHGDHTWYSGDRSRVFQESIDPPVPVREKKLLYT